jgi:hypothetical protein
MNQEEVVVESWKATPPVIGKRPKCQAEILASHFEPIDRSVPRYRLPSTPEDACDDPRISNRYQL